jgi:regulator of protease activity HflC (stomatin/prohibitin superfamily)
MPGTILLALAIAVVAAIIFSRSRKAAIIYPPDTGLLYRNGRVERELGPGRHGWFDPFGRTKLVRISLAALPAQIGEITVLSKDQFSFRLALAPVLKVIEPRLFNESQPAAELHGLSHLMPMAAHHLALHPLVAAAALEVAATRTLAEILADQKSVAEGVTAKLELAIPGAIVERVLVTAINLPPETRRMFTDVERARMEGQAALERARGEQAALRVLANAARLVADNPALAHLRLLQAIESSKGATTLVVGNPAAANPLGAAGPP